MKTQKAYSISNVPWGEQFKRLPNILSITRVVLLPVIWYMLALNTKTSLIFSSILIGVILLTDALDGYLAKHLDEQTELGLVLDPLCDKITTVTLLTLYVVFYDFPLWLLVLIVARDLTILLFSWIFARKTRAVFRSDFFGRWAFIVLSAMIVVYSFSWVELDLTILKNILLAIVIIFMLLSSTQYLLNFLREWSKQVRKV